MSIPSGPNGVPNERASRLDNSHDAEMRKLIRRDMLIIDDFALQALDALDTADVYELIVERHRSAATVVTSNKEPIEWLGMMADALLAQSAIDRLKSAANELVLDGESYRIHQKPTVAHPDELLTRHQQDRVHHDVDVESPREPVPCQWRSGGPIKLAHDTVETSATRSLSRLTFLSSELLRLWRVRGPDDDRLDVLGEQHPRCSRQGVREEAMGPTSTPPSRPTNGPGDGFRRANSAGPFPSSSEA